MHTYDNIIEPQYIEFLDISKERLEEPQCNEFFKIIFNDSAPLYTEVLVGTLNISKFNR